MTICFKRITLIVFAFLMGLSIAYPQKQEELVLGSKDTIITSYWILGIGTYIVDDSGDTFDGFFNIEGT